MAAPRKQRPIKPDPKSMWGAKTHVHRANARSVGGIEFTHPTGSNDIANFFPEKRDVAPGYKVKDKLENRLHELVCTEHTMTLRAVQKAIAKNWETLHKTVYGVSP